MTSRQRLGYLVGFLVLFGGLRAFAVGPLNWDPLKYLDLSLDPFSDPTVLNRYVHVYLQRVFVIIAGSGLRGANLYWSALIAGTALLTYGNAAALLPRSRSLNGIIAVVFLFAQPIILRHPGTTYADHAAAFFVALGLAIYVSYHRSDRRHPGLLFLFGLVLFLAVKSKETGIILAPLVLGIDRPDRAGGPRRGAAGKVLWLAGGLATGQLLLMLLDALWLGDPLFSLRPSSWAGMTNHMFRPAARPSMSWYAAIVNEELAVPFVLALVSFFRLRRTLSFQMRLLWILPIWEVVVLTVLLVAGNTDVNYRHTATMFPVVCVLAAQFLHVESDRRGLLKKRLALAGLSGVGLFLLWASLAGLLYMLEGRPAGWTPAGFLRVIVYPLAFSLLAILSLTVREWRGIPAALGISGLLMVTVVPISGFLAVRPQAARVVAEEFRPFRVYADSIRYTPEMTMLVSNGLHEADGSLGVDRDSCKRMFTVFFDQPADFDQFAYDDPRVLVRGGFTYAFLSEDEWEQLRSEGLDRAIGARYAVARRAGDRFRCLHRRTIRADG